MRLSYDVKEPDETVRALAKKLVDIIVAENVSYGKSMEALDCAQRLIEVETKPVFND